MRIVERPYPLNLEPPAVVLVFSEREKATMLAASAIADRARQMCAKRFGDDWTDSDEDYALAEAEYAHKDVIDGVDLTPFAEATR